MEVSLVEEQAAGAAAAGTFDGAFEGAIVVPVVDVEETDPNVAGASNYPS